MTIEVVPKYSLDCFVLGGKRCVKSKLDVSVMGN